MKTILITGGAGFIGSHLVRLFVNKYPEYKIVNLDKLTYAGNLANLTDIEDKPNYEFVKGDIVDADFILKLFIERQFDGVIHLAAESHVDRSITNPTEFVFTNVIGTVNLLNAVRHIWKDKTEGKRFYHISTDEVYGSLGSEGMFTEETGYVVFPAEADGWNKRVQFYGFDPLRIREVPTRMAFSTGFPNNEQLPRKAAAA